MTGQTAPDPLRKSRGPVAQWLEPTAHNGLVAGSSPAGPTTFAFKGYDTDAIRQQVEASGAAPNIPPKVDRRWKACFSPALYRGRNAIERMFCRLTDIRRVATRYDRLAGNYLAAVCLAAIVSYWL
jgi:hypothetical protein